MQRSITKSWRLLAVVVVMIVVVPRSAEAFVLPQLFHFCIAGSLRHRVSLVQRYASSVTTDANDVWANETDATAATSIPAIPSIVATNRVLPTHPTNCTVSLLSKSLSLDTAEITQQIDTWVRQRAVARWDGDYATADALRQTLLQYEVSVLQPASLALCLQDFPRTTGGGSQWTVSRVQGERPPPRPGPTVLQLAHAALGAAVAAAQATQRNAGSSTNHAAIQDLVEQALERLGTGVQEAQKDRNSDSTISTSDSAPPQWAPVSHELRGRKAADAAFWFALAGVTNQTLYNRLLQVGLYDELDRFGRRPSCRSKDIRAMVDRFAAAGVGPDDRAVQFVSDLLRTKQQQSTSPLDQTNRDEGMPNQRIIHDQDVRNRWNLHSNAVALLVWKFSTRQRKPSRDLYTTAARHWEASRRNVLDATTAAVTPATGAVIQENYNWTAMYADPSRPLVIDIGCGMGLSLLGVASTAALGHDNHKSKNDQKPARTFTDMAACNFLGVDLNGLAIGYAQGLAQRWKLQEALQFVVDAAERAVEAVQTTYPGTVAHIWIQFPTPYRLLPHNVTTETSSTYQGNTQLPKTAQDGFMVSKNLLKSIGTLMGGSSATLLLQCNCEDVALYMYHSAIKEGHMTGVPAMDPRWDMPEPTTQRTQTWLAARADSPELVERAMGAIWWNSPVLPRQCQTETEIACTLNKTPVHRCLLKSAKLPESTDSLDGSENGKADSETKAPPLQSLPRVKH